MCTLLGQILPAASLSGVQGRAAFLSSQVDSSLERSSGGLHCLQPSPSLYHLYLLFPRGHPKGRQN